MPTTLEPGAPVRLVRWLVRFSDGHGDTKTVVSLKFPESEHKDCPSWHVAGTRDTVCLTCTAAAVRLAEMKQFAGHPPTFLETEAECIGEALAKAR